MWGRWKRISPRRRRERGEPHGDDDGLTRRRSDAAKRRQGSRNARNDRKEEGVAAGEVGADGGGRAVHATEFTTEFTEDTEAFNREKKEQGL